MRHGPLAGIAFVFSIIAAGFSLVPVGTAHAQAPVSAGARPPPNSANYHGTNSLQPSDDLATGRRHFEAGAHTAWHIHPGGQLIFVEEGTAVVQKLDEPLLVVHSGAAEFTSAGIPHWHGAAPHEHALTAMVHFGGIGPWLDPVTNEEYSERTQSAGLPASATPANASPPGNYVGTTQRMPSDDLQVARGRFEADAYSFWHIHPAGQVVFAEQGPVIVQKRGEAMQILHEGEADYTSPGVPHWHGSGPYSYALKVVLGFGAPTEWLGEPVSEQEYAQARRFFSAER